MNDLRMVSYVLPKEMDAAVGEITRHTGQSRHDFIQEAIRKFLPALLAAYAQAHQPDRKLKGTKFLERAWKNYLAQKHADIPAKVLAALDRSMQASHKEMKRAFMAGAHTGLQRGNYEEVWQGYALGVADTAEHHPFIAAMMRAQHLSGIRETFFAGVSAGLSRPMETVRSRRPRSKAAIATQPTIPGL